MDRLTEHFGLYIRIKGLQTIYSSKYSKTALLNNAIIKLTAYENAMPLERAQELAQAEKDGRLVVLPCKVGDTLWTNIAIVGGRYIMDKYSHSWWEIHYGQI